MGFGLALLGLFLLVSMAGVVAASVREARLPPGTESSPPLRRRGLIAAAVSLGLMAAAVLLGGKWWNVEAADYAENITTFAAAQTTATLTANQLDLHVAPRSHREPPLHPTQR